jgi:radical SAM protein with 4Fe4S-binding SPASM domain
MTNRVDKDDLHHDVAGEGVFNTADERVREYRRKWEENPRRLESGAFPIHLDIEVTSRCNLKCPFCATTYGSDKFVNGQMTWETARKILDEAGAEGAYSCKFNIRGEPLLNRETPRFVRYAKEKGLVDVFFNTNATLLTENVGRELIEAGLDRMTISFEGFEKAVYEKNRVGATFEKTVDNIVNFRRLRERMGKKYPKVRLQAVLVPELKGRLDEFIAFWKDKVDQVSYNEMLPNVPKSFEPIRSTWICPFPYQRLAIFWDGSVTTCYNDFFGHSVMGNVHTTSLKECWQVELEKLRRLFIEGRAHEQKACWECPLRMSEVRKRADGSEGAG